jgi:hypothetical protein
MVWRDRGISVLQKYLVHERGESGAKLGWVARSDDFCFFTFGMGATFASDGSYRSDLVLRIEFYCHVVLFDC